MLVGAPGNDEKGEGAGRASVYSGKDGSVLMDFYGEEAGDQFGSSAGGFVDKKQAFLVVGAPNAGPGDRGRTYVYRGTEGQLAFIIESDEEGSQLGGMFVSVVGDVNADETPDIYASDWSHNAKGPMTGQIYVHSGIDGKRLMLMTILGAGSYGGYLFDSIQVCAVVGNQPPLADILGTVRPLVCSLLEVHNDEIFALFDGSSRGFVLHSDGPGNLTG